MKKSVYYLVLVIFTGLCLLRMVSSMRGSSTEILYRNEKTTATMRVDEKNYKITSKKENEQQEIGNKTGQLTSQVNQVNRLDYEEKIASRKSRFPLTIRTKLLSYIRGIYDEIIGIRIQLLERLERIFPQSSSALLAGILLGNQELFSKQLLDTFRQSGLVHIVVASGGNIAILTSIIVVTLGAYFSRKVTLYITFSLVILYLLLAGFEPPLIRASIMVSLTWVAQLVGRKTHSLYVLTLTALCMLLVEPQLVTSLSFQLSVAATRYQPAASQLTGST